MTRRTYELTTGLHLAVHTRDEPALFRSLFGTVEERTLRADIDLSLSMRLREPSERGRYKGIPWGINAREQDGGIALAFGAPFFTAYLALHLAVIPAAQAMLRRAGRALVAGAAVQTPGGATLFLGGTGAGKTGAMLRAVAAGAHPVGDEYVALGAGGELDSLLHGVAVRRNLRIDAPALYGRLSRRDRGLVTLFHVGALASGGRLRPLLHVAWPQLGLLQERAESSVARAVWIDAGAREPHAVTPAEIATRAARHMEARAAAYGSPIPALGIGTPGDDRAVLERALASAECYVAPSALAAALSGAPAQEASLTH